MSELSGQFGIVYRGHSASSGFAVAVKIIDKRKIWGNAQLAVRKAADKPHETPKLVKKELEILQRLSHVNVPGYLDLPITNKHVA